MKKLLLGLYLLFTSIVNSQTLIAYDYIEAWNWGVGGAGWSVGCGPCGYYTNTFVSSTQSAALIGTGNASSPTESGTYILTNITGLSSISSYMFTFRAGAYKIANSAAATAGNDIPDYFEVQYSSNNGLTWSTEMKITGFSNALWNYNTNATASKFANGTLTTYAPTVGGDRTSTGDGYSIIQLTLPIGVTQLAFRIPTRVNSAGEEWWFDNFELLRMYSLPIELTDFTGHKSNECNVLKWQTASEHNSDYFLIERSTTGESNENSVVNTKSAAGNSTELLDYAFIDKDFTNTINYYRLTQVDYDGNFKQYGPIAIDNRNNGIVIKHINLLGQEVNNSTPGILFEVYEDGSMKRIWNP